MRLALAFAASLASVALGETRFGCPPARSPASNLVEGPCGPVGKGGTGDFSGALIQVQPGPFTVRIEESVARRGAPWRIALSGDSDDGTPCTLLDHIPHDDTSRPPAGAPEDVKGALSHQLLITVMIPDVRCERCSLQLGSFDIVDDPKGGGYLAGLGCTDTDPVRRCPLSFYSCTTPLNISGSIPRYFDFSTQTTRFSHMSHTPFPYISEFNSFCRDEYSCSATDAWVAPADWPLAWEGSDGARVDTSHPAVYRHESARWGETSTSRAAWAAYTKTPPREGDAFGSFNQSRALVAARWTARALMKTPRVLLEAPARYRQMAGPVCVETTAPDEAAAANSDAANRQASALFGAAASVLGAAVLVGLARRKGRAAITQPIRPKPLASEGGAWGGSKNGSGVLELAMQRGAAGEGVGRASAGRSAAGGLMSR